jgi:hypothetical protein
VRAIESIRVGDSVLTQDTGTGVLTFAPVLSAFHNKPSATLRICLDDEDEPVVVTGIHRFWKAGRGWVMARDLVPGDLLRNVAGRARVTSITEGEVQPVFNLEVAEGQSFFAGRAGALVHDHSIVQPVARPFDEVPRLVDIDSDSAE